MRFFDAGGKRAAWCVHRRGGKDLTLLHQTCKMAHRRAGAYWHVFPDSEQGRKALWEGFTKDGDRIMEQVFPRAIRKAPREFTAKQEMVVELRNGSIWRLVGSDFSELVGAGPVGVVFSEFALARPRAWDLIRPMLRENNGWAAFISTPRGNNHFKKLFDMAEREPGWFAERLSLWDTRAYDPEATVAEERAQGMPEALIQQEYFCDWTAANVGAVYGDLLLELDKGGKTGLDLGTGFACFTSWDLGLADKTAIWVWALDSKGAVVVLDYHDASGRPFSYFADWLKARPYRYLKHWLPHDARARTLLTGGSVVELASQAFGASAVGITPELSLADGIQASRWLLQRDIRFDARCTEGLEVLRAYSYEWDDDAKVLSRKPRHDWASHGADAFRYLACVVRVSESVSDAAAKPPPAPSTQPVTLDSLWAESRRKDTSWRR